MADVQVFFNRPLTPIDLTQLCNDIRVATDRVAIASAWFTDTAIAEAFVASPAYHKVAVFNQHDLARGSRKAVSMVQKHIAELIEAEGMAYKKRDNLFQLFYPTWMEEWMSEQVSIDEFRAKEKDAREKANKQIPIIQIGRDGIIGSKDWQNGIMHHKFIVADDVVWFGSFNFTYNAKNNYETLARVDDSDTAALFWIEAQCMVDDADAWDDNNEGGAHGSFLAKCAICQKMFPSNLVCFIDSQGGVGCPDCSKVTEY